MAGFNPFKKFRAYQKFGLAALGLMAIISFIILPVFTMHSGGNSTGKDTVFATCRQYGDVTGMRLHTLRNNRSFLGNFYTILAQELYPLAENNQEALMGLFQVQMKYAGPVLDEDVITEWMLARYSEEIGCVIGRELIVDYLKSLTGNMITTAILESSCAKLGITVAQLIPLLQEELLSANAVQMFAGSIRSLTPLARWDYFQRVRRSLSAEVAAISVDSFLHEVPAPSETQLKDFFEANKKVVYNPALPDSGFAVPTRVAFQVIDTLPTEELIASITQEEIGQFYEENKTRFFMRQPLQPESPAQSNPFDRSLPGLDPGNTLLPTLPGPDSGSNLLFPNLKSPSFPSSLSPLEEQPTENTTQPEESADPTEPVEPATETTEDGETQNTRNVVYRPVVWTQETDIELEPAKEETGEATEENTQIQLGLVPPKILIQEEEEEYIMQSTVESTESEMPEVIEVPEALFLDSESGSSGDDFGLLLDSLESLGSQDVDISILFQPLEEVEPLIRQILAFQKVNDAIPEIEKVMRDYFTAYSLADLDKPETLPKPIDLVALAAQYHLKCVVVEQPVSQFEAQNEEYYRFGFVRAFMDRIFTSRPAHFDVLIGREGGEMQSMPGFITYIGWMTERESQKTPEFSDPGIRDEVLKRWREVEARVLAMKKAQELADEANLSKGRTLKDVFLGKDFSIVETERFSWYTQSAASAGYARSQLLFGKVCEVGVPAGEAEFENKVIKAPGHQFMQVAYSLDVNECGATFNQPENTAYVIRIIESAPSEDLLMKFFSTTPLREYEGAGAWLTRQENYKAWVNAVEARLGFKWVLRPSARSEMMQAE